MQVSHEAPRKARGWHKRGMTKRRTGATGSLVWDVTTNRLKTCDALARGCYAFAEPNGRFMIRELIEFRQMLKEATRTPGQIGASDLYTIAEVQRRLGLSSWAMWRARRRGLKVYKISRHRFILGKDYIAYVESTGAIGS